MLWCQPLKARRIGQGTVLNVAGWQSLAFPLFLFNCCVLACPSTWGNSACRDAAGTKKAQRAAFSANENEADSRCPDGFGAFRITRKAFGILPKIWVGRGELQAACFPPNSFAPRAYPGPGLNPLDVYGNSFSVSMYPGVILALTGLKTKSGSSCFALFF